MGKINGNGNLTAKDRKQFEVNFRNLDPQLRNLFIPEEFGGSGSQDVNLSFAFIRELALTNPDLAFCLAQHHIGTYALARWYRNTKNTSQHEGLSDIFSRLVDGRLTAIVIASSEKGESSRHPKRTSLSNGVVLGIKDYCTNTLDINDISRNVFLVSVAIPKADDDEVQRMGSAVVIGDPRFVDPQPESQGMTFPETSTSPVHFNSAPIYSELLSISGEIGQWYPSSRLMGAVGMGCLMSVFLGILQSISMELHYQAESSQTLQIYDDILEKFVNRYEELGIHINKNAVLDENNVALLAEMLALKVDMTAFIHGHEAFNSNFPINLDEVYHFAEQLDIATGKNSEFSDLKGKLRILWRLTPLKSAASVSGNGSDQAWRFLRAFTAGEDTSKII